MKRKITIGIPRALLYYRYNVLWKTFFENLGCNIVLSPETTRETLEIGRKYSIDESCLSAKIYFGHVYYLIDKADYILVPRYCDYGKGKKVCVKFNGLYDNVKSLFPSIKILNYNIENTKRKYQLFGFIKMGLKVNKNIFKIIKSYFKAKRKQKEHNLLLINKQKALINKEKINVLIVSHPYNIYDSYVGQPVIKILRELNVNILYADRTNRKESIINSKKISNTLYWLYSKELIGSIEVYKNNIDGIIFLTSFPCGPDSLVNELVIRKIDIPAINLIIDESTSPVGMQTRLESFIDIIKERKNND